MSAPPRFRLTLYIGLFLVIIQAGSVRAWQSAPPDLGIASKPTLEVLENGLRVIVVERDSAPLAAVELRVRAGTAYETPENNGVAHFIEHLLFKGTATRKPGDVDAAIEGVGGELTANTGKDWAQFATVVPSSAWRTAIEALADVAQRPAFRAEDIENERRVILSELASAEADPTRAPFTALSAVAFPEDHPYRLSLYGPEATIRRLKREDLLAFWRARYTPGSMTLVVVGQVKRADVVGAARALFDATARPGGPPPSDLPEPGPIRGIERALPLERDRALVSVVIGFRAPSVKAAADAVAADVLLNILSVGARGRLNDELVRKPPGVALAVSADYLTQRAGGLLTLTAIGRGGSEQRLEEALLAEVKRLREDGVTAAELEAARRALIGQALFDEETFAGQASALGFYDAIDSYEFAVRYPERIRAVTLTDISRVIRTYLTPENYAVATMVPRRPRPVTPPSQLTEARR